MPVSNGLEIAALVREIRYYLELTQLQFAQKVRALRQLQREYLDTPWLFNSERKAPLTTRTVRDILNRAAGEAGLGYSIHPHMIRHSTGFYLASKGFDTRKIQDYLGHRQIQNSVRYTRLAPGQFEGMWD